MKRLLLLLISFTICSFLYSDDLTDKKAKLREQVVKNFKENKIDNDLIIEYAKLFLPNDFLYNNKIKTPYLNEDNYYWTISFRLKNEYITDDLFIDGIATVGYTVTVRKETGEAMLNGWTEIILNDYQIHLKNFRQKINQYYSLLKSIKNYNQFCQFYERMNYLTDKFIGVTENDITSYVDTVSNEILKIRLNNSEEPLKEAYDKCAVSCITYRKNEEELVRVYLLNDEDYDLLLIINDVSERKILKYLISEKTNDFNEEIINVDSQGEVVKRILSFLITKGIVKVNGV